MVSEFRSWDDFFWPGTQVLRNKLGLQDQDQLDRAERALTYGRLIALRTTSVAPGRFDLTHLQAIHRYLFQDIYDWAGEVRTFTLVKGETEFCRPEHVASCAAEVFGGLANNDLLRGLDIASFVHEAAELLGHLNALHPFREGNGRTQRAFLELLSDAAGHPVVWPEGMEQRNIEASIASMRGDNSGLRELIAESVRDSAPPVSDDDQPPSAAQLASRSFPRPLGSLEPSPPRHQPVAGDPPARRSKPPGLSL